MYACVIVYTLGSSLHQCYGDCGCSCIVCGSLDDKNESARGADASVRCVNFRCKVLIRRMRVRPNNAMDVTAMLVPLR